MTALLNDGEPIAVEADGPRIGAGPWARWLASAVVPDESSARAERGRALARAGVVASVAVSEGTITARVPGSQPVPYDVSIRATPVPASAWQAASRAARRRPAFASALAGRAQSVHLAHLLATEHATTLAPPSSAIRSSCTCPDDYAAPCKHVAAVAFVVAAAIDRDPSLFLRWRGCEPVEPSAAASGDPWAAGPLPEPRPLRALPAGAVLKRLGRSGIRVQGVDLAEALEPAYAAFAATRGEPA